MAGSGEQAQHGPVGDGRPSSDELLGLRVEDVAELTDGQVTAALIDLAELSGRVSAALARVTSSFDIRALHTIDGARTAASWVAARTELARPASTAALALGRELHHTPHVDAAAAAGRLGAAKVRLLLAARDRVEALFAQSEETLVQDVEPLTVDHTRRYLDAWRAIALATSGEDDGPAPGNDTDANEVHLSSTFQNRWRMDADLDDLTGDAINSALDAWIDARIREGVLDPTGMKRSQMRARALAALVGVGNEATSPRAQRRADVRIAWDAADLFGKPLADDIELERRRCITDRGTHLYRPEAFEALCNADVTDLLVHFGLDGTTTVLGVTHTRRYPTDKERAALVERDRGCVFPGCEAPVSWCDAHHTIPYEVGRITRLDELVLLCPHHHRQVHRGFTLSRSLTGKIRVTRPDGTPVEVGTGWAAEPTDRGHKLPVRSSRLPDGSSRDRPARFAPGYRPRPPDPPPGPPEPFDPVHEAEIDAAIQRRLLAVS